MNLGTPGMARARRGVEVLGRSTSRAVLATGGTNIVTAVAGGVGGIALARGLGPSDRGHLVTVLQWPTVTAVLASLGITTATCYAVSRDSTAGSGAIATAQWCAVIVGLAVAVLGVGAIAPLVSRTSQVDSGLDMNFLAAPAFIVAGVYVSALQATNIRQWNAARVVQPFGYLGLVLLLTATGRLSLLTATGSYVGSIGFAAMLAGHLVRRSVGPLTGSSWRHARRLYSYGPKVTLSSLPQIVNVQLDQLVLSVLPTVAAASLGNYVVAVSMATLVLPVAVAVGSVAFPMMAGATSEPRRQRIERRSITFAGLAAAAVAMVLVLAAPIAAPRAFGDGFGPAVRCLWLLAPGVTCLAVSRVVGDLLRGRGRPLRALVAEVGGALITVPGMVWLVPKYGIYGAAALSSVSYAVVLAILLQGLRTARKTDDADLGR